MIRHLATIFSICFFSYSLSAEPNRIVSLAPIATESLFALGVGDKVVGVTNYCDRPNSVQEIAKIGGFADPQLESIIKLRPDLVVATPFGKAKSVVISLQKRGINTVSKSVATLNDMKGFLRELAAATGRSSKAEELLKRFDLEYKGFKDRLKQSPKVLVLVSTSPLVAAGPSTFVGEVIEHIGAKNSVASKKASWPIISLETLIKTPPEIIIIAEGTVAEKTARSSLAILLSKHKGKIRIIVPKSPLLQRPGPYLIEDVRSLVKELS